MIIHLWLLAYASIFMCIIIGCCFLLIWKDFGWMDKPRDREAMKNLISIFPYHYFNFLIVYRLSGVKLKLLLALTFLYVRFNSSLHVHN